MVKGHRNLDAISGATVTVIAENQVIAQCALRSCQTGRLVKAVQKPQATFADDGKPRSWQQLVSDGAVQHLVVQPGELGEVGSGQTVYRPVVRLPEPSADRPFGTGGRWLPTPDARPGPADHALFIIGSGAGSFKGSASCAAAFTTG